MKLKITGQSVSGIGTCVAVPELKVYLDMGVMLPEGHRYPTVFLTHCHTDHVGALMSYVATRDMMKMTPPTIYVPPYMEAPLHAAFGAWRALDNQTKLTCDIKSLTLGEEVWLAKQWKVAPFPTVHRTVSQGYAFFYVRDKLRPEFVGLNVKALRDQGVEVMERKESLELAYTGDTTTKVFTLNPWLKDAKHLVVETTFTCDDMTVEEARKRGHTHLNEFVANPDLLPKGEVTFCHFSRRQDQEETVEAVCQSVCVLDPNLTGRIHIL